MSSRSIAHSSLHVPHILIGTHISQPFPARDTSSLLEASRNPSSARPNSKAPSPKPFPDYCLLTEFTFPTGSARVWVPSGTVVYGGAVSTYRQTRVQQCPWLPKAPALTVLPTWKVPLILGRWCQPSLGQKGSSPLPFPFPFPFPSPKALGTHHCGHRCPLMCVQSSVNRLDSKQINNSFNVLSVWACPPSVTRSHSFSSHIRELHSWSH